MTESLNYIRKHRLHLRLISNISTNCQSGATISLNALRNTLSSF